MLVRFSILSAASGSAGGVTATHGRSGQVLAARTVPTDPASPYQNAVRQIFAYLTGSWQTLTDAQRAAWTTYAANVPVTNRLGDTRYLTGHQIYIRNNAARLQAGLARVDDGPTVFVNDVLSYVYLTPNAGPNTLDMYVEVGDPWTIKPGGALLVYATRQSAGTVRYRKTPYRLAAVILAPLNPPAPRVFTPAAPFAIDDNQSNSIFTRFVVVTADGRLSAVDARGPTLIKTV